MTAGAAAAVAVKLLLVCCPVTALVTAVIRGLVTLVTRGGGGRGAVGSIGTTEDLEAVTIIGVEEVTVEAVEGGVTLPGMEVMGSRRGGPGEGLLGEGGGDLLESTEALAGRGEAILSSPSCTGEGVWPVLTQSLSNFSWFSASALMSILHSLLAAELRLARSMSG